MCLIVAFFDANVLYPAPLRDLFMRLMEVGLVQGKWSDMVHDEWIRNLLANRTDLTREKLENTKFLMNRHGGDCSVVGFEHLIPTLTDIDEGDRHVVAAAIHGGAEVIVTRNLKHFPQEALERHDLEAQDPDEFVAELFRADPGAVCDAVRRQRVSLRKPPQTIDQLLATFRKNHLNATVELLQLHLDKL